MGLLPGGLRRAGSERAGELQRPISVGGRWLDVRRRHTHRRHRSKYRLTLALVLNTVLPLGGSAFPAQTEPRGAPCHLPDWLPSIIQQQRSQSDAIRNH